MGPLLKENFKVKYITQYILLKGLYIWYIYGLIITTTFVSRLIVSLNTITPAVQMQSTEEVIASQLKIRTNFRGVALLKHIGITENVIQSPNMDYTDDLMDILKDPTYATITYLNSYKMAGLLRINQTTGFKLVHAIRVRPIVGNLLYAFLSKGHPLASTFSSAILSLQQYGFAKYLILKYCTEKVYVPPSKGNFSPIGLDEIGGAFYVLYGGLTISCITFLVEICRFHIQKLF